MKSSTPEVSLRLLGCCSSCVTSMGYLQSCILILFSSALQTFLLLFLRQEPSLRTEIGSYPEQYYICSRACAYVYYIICIKEAFSTFCLRHDSWMLLNQISLQVSDEGFRMPFMWKYEWLIREVENCRPIPDNTFSRKFFLSPDLSKVG